MRVRPILIPGDDSKPGFRFLLSHCTLAGGRARGAALFPPASPNASAPSDFMLELAFWESRHSSWSPGTSAGLQAGSEEQPREPPAPPWPSPWPRARRCCCGHSRFHPETGSFCLAACRVSREAPSCHSRDPGARHGSLVSQHLEAGQPRAAASLVPGASLARPRQAGRGAPGCT